KLTGNPDGQPVTWSVAGSPWGRIGLAGAGRPARGVGSPMRSSRAMVTANSGHKSAASRRRAAVRLAHPVQTWASATGRSQAVIAQAVVIGASSVDNPWRRRGEAGRAGQRSSLRSRQTTYHPLGSLTDTKRGGALGSYGHDADNDTPVRDRPESNRPFDHRRGPG